MIRKILQVYPIDGYRVYLYFADGKIKLFDAGELVKQGVFRALADERLFRETCTVLNDTLAWDLGGRYDPEQCLDLDPEELYETCPDVAEPLYENSGAVRPA